MPTGDRSAKRRSEAIDWSRLKSGGGVDGGAGAFLVHIDGGLGKARGPAAPPAGVVEVDVGDGDARQVVGVDAVGGEGSQQRRNRRLAPSFDQHGRRSLDEIARRYSL